MCEETLIVLKPHKLGRGKANIHLKEAETEPIQRDEDEEDEQDEEVWSKKEVGSERLTPKPFWFALQTTHQPLPSFRSERGSATKVGSYCFSNHKKPSLIIPIGRMIGPYASLVDL